MLQSNSPNTTPNLPFAASTSDRWVNGLWFTSLTFSLATALLVVLTKQWLNHYTSSTSGTPQDRARLMHYRFVALEKWHVPAIIGTLPILLHIALLMFFVGLILFLFHIDQAIAYTTTAVTITVYAVYFFTAVLPVALADCPYKTPLSTVTSMLWQKAQSFLRKLWSLVNKLRQRLLVAFGFAIQGTEPYTMLSHSDDEQQQTVPSLSALEKQKMLQDVDMVDAQMLIRLHSSSSSPPAARITLQAISGLRTNFTQMDKLRLTLYRDLLRFMEESKLSVPGAFERSTRAFLHFTPEKWRDVPVISNFTELYANKQPALLPVQYLFQSEQLSGGDRKIGDSALVLAFMADSVSFRQLHPVIWLQLFNLTRWKSLHEFVQPNIRLGNISTMPKLLAVDAQQHGWTIFRHLASGPNNLLLRLFERVSQSNCSEENTSEDLRTYCNRAVADEAWRIVQFIVAVFCPANENLPSYAAELVGDALSSNSKLLVSSHSLNIIMMLIRENRKNHLNINAITPFYSMFFNAALIMH
jgi:hypothetical protein